MVKAYRSIFITEDHAARLRPVLQWVEEAAPHTRERSTARSLLGKIRNVREWKQLLLTRPEYEILAAVHLAFPEGATPEGHQYKLAEPLEESEVVQEARKSVPTIGGRYEHSQCRVCGVWTPLRDKFGDSACSEHKGLV